VTIYLLTDTFGVDDGTQTEDTNANTYPKYK